MTTTGIYTRHQSRRFDDGGCWTGAGTIQDVRDSTGRGLQRFTRRDRPDSRPATVLTETDETVCVIGEVCTPTNSKLLDFRF